jgi:hypothetical protein
MAPDARLVRRATFALLVFASAATEIAAVESRPVLTSLALAAIWVGLAGILGLFARPPERGRRMPPRCIFLLLLLLAATPFVVERLRRQWTGEGYPLELQMVFALRNVGLGLAAFAVWPLCLRSACVVSLFLMLFAVTLTAHPAVLWLLGLYSATGSVWLMLVYWADLRRSAAVHDVAVLEMQPGRHRLPWFGTFVVMSVIGCLLAMVALGPQRVARALGEWLPTSGGTGDNDPFARGGINDGDDSVRGNKPRSTGMVETDQFLDSPLPSLYDMTNDLYGEPFKPKDQEWAIPLAGRGQFRESDRPPPDTLRPSRDFATTRRGPRQPRDASDRAARALFEVQGRTPLHVRAAAFDVFDGVSWQEAPVNLSTCLLDKERGSCWMKVQERTPARVFAESESHRFKIATSFGSLVPTPPHLTRFRVGRVDQASFFAWSQNRILRMAQRKTPSGIVVETDSRTVDPRLLADVYFPFIGSNEESPLTAVPTNLDAGILLLVPQWVEGKRRVGPRSLPSSSISAPTTFTIRWHTLRRAAVIRWRASCCRRIVVPTTSLPRQRRSYSARSAIQPGW